MNGDSFNYPTNLELVALLPALFGALWGFLGISWGGRGEALEGIRGASVGVLEAFWRLAACGWDWEGTWKCVGGVLELS